MLARSVNHFACGDLCGIEAVFELFVQPDRTCNSGIQFDRESTALTEFVLTRVAARRIPPFGVALGLLDFMGLSDKGLSLKLYVNSYDN